MASMCVNRETACNNVCSAPKTQLPLEVLGVGLAAQDLSYSEYTKRCAQVIARIRSDFSHTDRIALVTHDITPVATCFMILHKILWQRQTWFTLDDGSITAARFGVNSQAQRPNKELLPLVTR